MHGVRLPLCVTLTWRRWRKMLSLRHTSWSLTLTLNDVAQRPFCHVRRPLGSLGPADESIWYLESQGLLSVFPDAEALEHSALSPKGYNKFCGYSSYIQKTTLNPIETFKISIQRPKHQLTFSKIRHSFESTFSVHLYGPPLAGLKF